MEIIDRIKRLAYIVTKAAKPELEDEENQAYHENDDAGVAVGQEDTGAEVENLENMFGDTKKKRSPKIHYDMNNPEHRKLIREKLLNEREQKQKVNDFRDSEVEYTQDMAVAKFNKLRDELRQIEEAKQSGNKPPFMESLVKSEMDDLVSKFPQLPEIINNLDSFVGEDNGEEALPYDRAKDEEKNNQAKSEMQETLNGVDTDEANKRNDKIEIDDILVLADTMYSVREAKTGTGDMSMEELKALVMDKADRLGLLKEQTKEDKINAYLSGKFVLAQEDLEEEEEEDERPIDKETAKDYRLYKKMPLTEKISGASYVQLFALDKYFTKLLKAKKNEEAKNSAKEDEAVDIGQLEKSIGKKPAPATSPVKRLSIEEYEALKAKERQRELANASMRLSIREAVLNEHKEERVICNKCGDPEDVCECPGGPTLKTEE